MPQKIHAHRRSTAIAVALGLALTGASVAATPTTATADAVKASSTQVGEKKQVRKKKVSPSAASRQLRQTTKPAGIKQHLTALQKIADANGGNRASGLPGFEASRDYIVERLRKAGYRPKVQAFQFPYFTESTPAQLTQLTPDAKTYANPADFAILEFSGPGDVTGTVQAVDTDLAATETSTSGCEAADFTEFTAGNIALMQRGSCDFAVKAANAETAGATGAIIFNRGTPDFTDTITDATLGAPQSLPVVGASFATGVDLGTPGTTTARLVTDTVSESRTTWNVVANTQGGNDNQVVMAGAHLDSVGSGEGINDNGSGSASLLEVAEQMRKLKPRFKVRFAWWGAEESGLLGADNYVTKLPAGARKKIKLYLNFDMVGSPNFVRFVYDGDNSSFGEDDGAAVAPKGSDAIERTFNNYFRSNKLVTDPTAFDGRSDYGPFIDAGIPAGGLFTGAEGVKTAAQETRYGGKAGVAYDACYHDACDDITNISTVALNQMSDAMAHAIAVYSYRIGLLKGRVDSAPDQREKGDRKRSQMPGPHATK